MNRIVFNKEENKVDFFGLMYDSATRMDIYLPYQNKIVMKITRRFIKLFTDHPDITNCGVVLSYNENSGAGLHKIYFVCSHYEDAYYLDMKNIPKFMRYLKKMLKTNDHWSLPLIHADAEKIIFSTFVVYHQYDEVKSLLDKNIEFYPVLKELLS